MNAGPPFSVSPWEPEAGLTLVATLTDGDRRVMFYGDRGRPFVYVPATGRFHLDADLLEELSGASFEIVEVDAALVDVAAGRGPALDPDGVAALAQAPSLPAETVMGVARATEAAPDALEQSDWDSLNRLVADGWLLDWTPFDAVGRFLAVGDKKWERLIWLAYFNRDAHFYGYLVATGRFHRIDAVYEDFVDFDPGLSYRFVTEEHAARLARGEGTLQLSNRVRAELWRVPTLSVEEVVTEHRATIGDVEPLPADLARRWATPFPVTGRGHDPRYEEGRPKGS